MPSYSAMVGSAAQKREESDEDEDEELQKVLQVIFRSFEGC